MKSPRNFFRKTKEAGEQSADRRAEEVKKDRRMEQEDLTSEEESVKEGSLTEDDIDVLGPVDLSMDGGEDEQLRQRTHAVDFSGEDLDVPGAELDDEDEDIGSEDEENNPYSLGGDNYE
jgi:hypothetical protein